MKQIKLLVNSFWNIVKADKNTIKKRMVLRPDYGAPASWGAMAW